jgi:hypothetical protein
MSAAAMIQMPADIKMEGDEDDEDEDDDMEEVS